jgi:putative membrane protein
MVEQCMEMMRMMGGGMMGGMMGGGMMGPMLLWTLLLVALLGIGLVLIVRVLRSGTSGAGNAVHILQERFARGEIDREEFEERRSLLLGQH